MEFAPCENESWMEFRTASFQFYSMRNPEEEGMKVSFHLNRTVIASFRIQQSLCITHLFQILQHSHRPIQTLRQLLGVFSVIKIIIVRTLPPHSLWSTKGQRSCIQHGCGEGRRSETCRSNGIFGCWSMIASLIVLGKLLDVRRSNCQGGLLE